MDLQLCLRDGNFGLWKIQKWQKIRKNGIFFWSYRVLTSNSPIDGVIIFQIILETNYTGPEVFTKQHHDTMVVLPRDRRDHDLRGSMGDGEAPPPPPPPLVGRLPNLTLVKMEICSVGFWWSIFFPSHRSRWELAPQHLCSQVKKTLRKALHGWRPMFWSVRGVPHSVFQTVCAHCVWASNLSWFHMSTLLSGVPPFCVQLVVAEVFLLQALLGVAGGL